MKLIPPDKFSHCIDNSSNLQNTGTSHKSNIHDFSTSVINNLVHNHFQLAIINCRSIVNKHDELQALIISEEIDLILGTEAHLDNSITNSEVFQQTLVFTGRTATDTEGVCLFSLETTCHPL